MIRCSLDLPLFKTIATLISEYCVSDSWEDARSVLTLEEEEEEEDGGGNDSDNNDGNNSDGDGSNEDDEYD